jgi:hypothetical protein
MTIHLIQPVSLEFHPHLKLRVDFRFPLKLQNPRSGKLIWGSGGPGGIRTLDTRKGILP